MLQITPSFSPFPPSRPGGFGVSLSGYTKYLRFFHNSVFCHFSAILFLPAQPFNAYFPLVSICFVTIILFDFMVNAFIQVISFKMLLEGMLTRKNPLGMDLFAARYVSWPEAHKTTALAGRCLCCQFWNRQSRNHNIFLLNYEHVMNFY